MRLQFLDRVDTRYIDRLLLKDGLVQPVHYAEIKGIPSDHLKLWCVKNAVYQIPTWELIHWLKREIAGRSAIEICAGKSCLGRHLGIRMVDNYMQTWPHIALYYEVMQQKAIEPPADVIEMDANEAVRRLNPQVVIGAWVSQKREDAEDFSHDGGNCYGPDEHEIADRCTYIHVGNLGAHQKKRLLIREHRELRYPWLVSRGIDPTQNRICVWDNQHC